MSGRIRTGDEVKQDVELTCDVCVVGAGAGGAWLAHELVAAGKSVVMLEEGGYFTRRDFDLTEAFAFKFLYQELGNRATDDLSVSILQGRSVGGGTTVNWTTSFRTPRRILQLWRDRHGVEGLSYEALVPHWEAIERRLHIAEWPEERMNANNRVLYDGCAKLGYHRGLLKRNVNNCANLGYCGMGCPLDAKQSMLVTVIPDAVEKGLDVYANASVRRLEKSGRKVTAVHADVLDPHSDRPTGVRIVVKPRLAAVCGGAINSPALLLRSGIDNGRVGKRTFLHPGFATLGLFEQDIEPFSGAPQSAYSHQFEDRGRGKLGFFIEVAPVFPMMFSAFAPGFGASHQEILSQLPHVNATASALIDGIDDDDEGGTVSLRSNGYGRVRFDYPLTERHWEAVRFACKEMAKIQLAAGARRVYSLHSPPVVIESERDIARLDDAPYEKLRFPLASFHQMGGCAMGKNPKTSVVDSTLRYHEMDNLYVVDGSVFPTSLGVNPQQTIFGIARWGARHLLAAL